MPSDDDGGAREREAKLEKYCDLRYQWLMNDETDFDTGERLALRHEILTALAPTSPPSEVSGEEGDFADKLEEYARLHRQVCLHGTVEDVKALGVLEDEILAALAPINPPSEVNEEALRDVIQRVATYACEAVEPDGSPDENYTVPEEISMPHGLMMELVGELQRVENPDIATVLAPKVDQREPTEAFSQGFEAGFFCGQKADPTGPLTQRIIEAATKAWTEGGS